MKSEKFAFNPEHKSTRSQPGVTYSDNPRDPLWKIHVQFQAARPMTELIKAPNKTAAKRFAEAKYTDPVKVTVIGRADQAVTSRRRRSTASRAAA